MSPTLQPIPVDFTALTSKIKVRKLEGKTMLYCPVRRKYLGPQPEEFVRQAVIQYFLEQGISLNRLSVEKKLEVNQQTRRTDIVVYNAAGEPALLVECKAPFISLGQDVFDQAARYNMTLNLKWFVITNGVQFYCCYVDIINKKYDFITELPNL